MRTAHLAPAFVEVVPEVLEAGTLYVCPAHATMLHLCACGCGSEVVLPLSPIDWRLTFDGETVSVEPSVGSWALPCRSHYVIDRGRVRWAGDWSEDEVRRGREHDRRRKASRYGRAVIKTASASGVADAARGEAAVSDVATGAPPRRGRFARALDRLRSRLGGG